MKPEYPEKTINLTEVTDKRDHILLNRVHLAWVGFREYYFVLRLDILRSHWNASYYGVYPTYNSKEERLRMERKIEILIQMDAKVNDIYP